MEQYLTTYKKDYTWPSKPPFATSYHQTDTQKKKVNHCYCNIGKNGRNVPKGYVSSSTKDSYEWSRLGPMGRLLDPKLYPAKTGPCPETEATRYGQPNTYLKKLEEKYPNLYGILQKAEMDETIRYVNADRMRSTYQVDYSNVAASEDEKCLQPCMPIKTNIQIECRPHAHRPRIQRNRELDDRKQNEKKNGKKSRKTNGNNGPETRPPPWRTEYQDGIGKIGQAIMRGKLHHKQKAATMWMMTT